MRCSPWVGSPLRRGVTPVPDGSVGTEGEWFRELEGAAQVAPACGQAARERVLAQIQPCQVVELAQLRGQGGQLVVGQSQCPQVVELAQFGGQRGQLIPIQIQLFQVVELAQLRRQGCALSTGGGCHTMLQVDAWPHSGAK